MAIEKELVALLEDLRRVNPAEVANDPNERKRALTLSRQLVVALENPIERAVDYIFKVSQD